MEQEDLLEMKRAVDDLRQDVREMRTMLTALLTKSMTDPADLVREIGSAVAKSQGFDRPVQDITGQPQDIFTDPSSALTMEPENEAKEREEELRRITEILSSPRGWEGLGIPTPPGEFDAGPDGE